jgi:6-phosphogluconate dehydrogenase (decarboxylating)
LVRRIARDSDIEVVVYDHDETNVRAIEDHGVAVVTADENPLVDGLRRLPVPPTTLVIFGATLARRRPLAGDRISLDGAGRAGR